MFENRWIIILAVFVLALRIGAMVESNTLKDSILTKMGYETAQVKQYCKSKEITLVDFITKEAHREVYDKSKEVYKSSIKK